MKMKCLILSVLLTFCLVICGCTDESQSSSQGHSSPATNFSLDSIPEYTTEAYVPIHNNQPDFTSDEYTTQCFEDYADLDSLGRCQRAYACVGIDTMPTEARGSIGQIKPTGWQTIKYDIVDGKYLYNRCHLIGYQLTAENANEKNLITGTRYLNIDGMLSFENMVADYVKETQNHVLYRVTPIFEGNNLLASGVEMEGYSVEDNGEGVCFHVYAYNVQPGIEIDYLTGNSHLASESGQSSIKEMKTYIVNTKTNKIHLPSCSSAQSLRPENKKKLFGSLEDLIAQGYSPCSKCLPQTGGTSK